MALQVQVASAIQSNPVLVHKLRVMLSHLEGTVPGQGIVHMKGVPISLSRPGVRAEAVPNRHCPVIEVQTH